MAELSAPLTEWLTQVIPQEAGSVHKSYPLVPREDIEQEMWAAVLSRRDSYEELVVSEGEYGKARYRLKNAAWKLVKEDDRYRRAIKAVKGGYHIHDEQFYTVAMLRTMLPMYLDQGVTERPPQGREQPRISRTSDPASGGDYLAMCLDLDEAFWAIKPYHRAILTRYFSPPARPNGYKNHAEIAGALGIEPNALKMRVDRALNAMQKELGGRNPWSRRDLEYSEPGRAA